MNELVAKLAERLVVNRLRLATAESCTGGGLGSELTALAGSSIWYEGGVVSYSNGVKQNVLQVPADLIKLHGAVSEPVSLAMAKGVQRLLQTDVSVAITGTAGPGGGSPEKAVGTVWVAWSLKQKSFAQCFLFSGDRAQVRSQAIEAALVGLVQLLD